MIQLVVSNSRGHVLDTTNVKSMRLGRRRIYGIIKQLPFATYKRKNNHFTLYRKNGKPLVCLEVVNVPEV